MKTSENMDQILRIVENYSNYQVLTENAKLEKLDWDKISGDPDATDLLKYNLDKVNWRILSGNRGAIELLEKNLDKVDWYYLSGNRGAIELLEKNLDKVDWSGLSANPAAIGILEKNLDKVDWKVMFAYNLAADKLLKDNSKIHNLYTFPMFCYVPSVKNMNKIDTIDWSLLCSPKLFRKLSILEIF